MKRQDVDAYIAEAKVMFRARFERIADDPMIDKAFLELTDALTGLTLPPLPPRPKGHFKKRALTLPPLRPKGRKRRQGK
jgi:hypothetical protein